MKFLLTLIFVDGEQREIVLGRSPETFNTELRYWDRDGIQHHVSLYSIKEWWVYSIEGEKK